MTFTYDEQIGEGRSIAVAALDRLKWSAVIPLKPFAAAKSRLDLRPVEGRGKDVRRQRERLARSFAQDTVAALIDSTSVESIVLVTSASDVADEFSGVDAAFIPDSGTGLNGAVRAGTAFARSAWPARAVFAMTGDLPCIRAGDIDQMTLLAELCPLAFVPDRANTGTTVLTALPGFALDPHFGEQSAAAHASSGMSTLPIHAMSPLRSDIDTAADLDDAIEASTLGRFTMAELLSQGRLPSAVSARCPRPRARPPEG